MLQPLLNCVFNVLQNKYILYAPWANSNEKYMKTQNWTCSKIVVHENATENVKKKFLRFIVFLKVFIWTRMEHFAQSPRTQLIINAVL